MSRDDEIHHRARVSFAALVALAGCAGVGCGKSEAPPATSLTDASVTDASTTAAAVVSTLPSLADAPKLTVLQTQGGPSQLRCGGVVYQLTVDLTDNAWTYGNCTAINSQKVEMANAPLTMKHGTLSKEDRARVELAYAKMTVVPKPTCAADAGALTLKVTRDKAVSTWFDASSGCTSGPSAVPAALGLRDFALALVTIVSASP